MNVGRCQAFIVCDHCGVTLEGPQASTTEEAQAALDAEIIARGWQRRFELALRDLCPDCRQGN